MFQLLFPTVVGIYGRKEDAGMKERQKTLPICPGVLKLFDKE